MWAQVVDVRIQIFVWPLYLGNPKLLTSLWTVCLAFHSQPMTECVEYFTTRITNTNSLTIHSGGQDDVTKYSLNKGKIPNLTACHPIVLSNILMHLDILVWKNSGNSTMWSQIKIIIVRAIYKLIATSHHNGSIQKSCVTSELQNQFTNSALIRMTLKLNSK